MSTISGPTLMMAIQAVAAQIRELEEDLETADDEEQADLHDLSHTYWKAAKELKTAYEEVRETAVTLPAYDSLVGRG